MEATSKRSWRWRKQVLTSFLLAVHALAVFEIFATPWRMYFIGPIPSFIHGGPTWEYAFEGYPTRALAATATLAVSGMTMLIPRLPFRLRLRVAVLSAMLAIGLAASVRIQHAGFSLRGSYYLAGLDCFILTCCGLLVAALIGLFVGRHRIET